MDQSWKDNHALYLIIIGLLAWLVPGAGHYALNERRRAVVIGVMIILTFLVGLYVGSIGVIDPIGAKPWYAAQIMNSPVVLLLGSHVASLQHRADKEQTEFGQAKISAYRVFGRPNEIGQIYTSIAGLLNLLCIVNAIYLAHLRGTGQTSG
jgi:hypothetical protein